MDTTTGSGTLSEAVVELAPSGERITFTSPLGATDRLAFDFELSPGGAVDFRHRHLRQSELFHCLQGTLDVAVEGVTRQLAPGDRAELPPGTVHSLVNRGVETVICEVEYRPAGRNREWFLLVGAATERMGREPGLLDLAPFLPDVDIVMPGPVAPQRFIIGFVLRPLAIVLGRRRRMLRIASEAYGRPFTW